MKDFLRFLRTHRPAQAGLLLIVLVLTCATAADLITPFGPMEAVPNRFFAPPGGEHVLGTDSQGRDLFSRLVHGSRYTLAVAVSATLLSLLAGALVGCLAGYFGRWVDMTLMRGVDFLMSFPSFLLACVAVAILGKSLANLIWAVGIAGAPSVARQVRAEVLRIRSLEYVEAAHSLGYSHFRILLRHVLPNCLSPIIVLGTLGMGGSILSVAGLAFLGLGGDPFLPEWGLMLKLGWDQSTQGAFQVGVSGACILGTVLGFNLFGDGLRDWLDPRARQR